MFSFEDGKLIINTTAVPKAVVIIIIIVIALLIIWGLLALNHYIFAKIQSKRSGLQLKFFERLNSVVIFVSVVLITLSAFGGVDSLWRTVLGGTAIFSAVAAFVAQDVLKDILSGLMISINKPFETGDLIELENGVIGVVTDMNARHVVLRNVDTMRVVIPNSYINRLFLSNYAFKREIQSYLFKFPVGYGSDIDLVKKIISDAVEESEFSMPGLPGKDGEKSYAPVYFLKIADSAFIMGVTVYFDKKADIGAVSDDINTRVRNALVAHHVDIPYQYINVVQKD